MPKTFNDYMTAEIEGDFVVFLTGMRLNRWWKIWKWIPVFFAMPRMNRELSRNRELGMLHYRYHAGLRSMLVVQYWSSLEKLQAYATDKSRAHLQAWRRMNRTVGLRGDVGTWHETYVVRKGDYECLYVNMPEFGLARAGRHLPARGPRRTARGRLGQSGSDGNDWADLDIPPAAGDSAPSARRNAAPDR